MGAALLAPLVQVARLLFAGLLLFTCGGASVVFECIGAGLATFAGGWTGSGTAGAEGSRAGSDFLNHDDVFVDRRWPGSPGSLFGVIVDDLRESIRVVLLLLGLIGSIASEKYSCSIACLDVGLAFGSHIKHHVTNCAKLAGHCGAGRTVSRE